MRCPIQYLMSRILLYSLYEDLKFIIHFCITSILYWLILTLLLFRPPPLLLAWDTQLLIVIQHSTLMSISDDRIEWQKIAAILLATSRRRYFYSFLLLLLLRTYHTRTVRYTGNQERLSSGRKSNWSVGTSALLCYYLCVIVHTQRCCVCVCCELPRSPESSLELTLVPAGQVWLNLHCLYTHRDLLH